MFVFKLKNIFDDKIEFWSFDTEHPSMRTKKENR